MNTKVLNTIRKNAWEVYQCYVDMAKPPKDSLTFINSDKYMECCKSVYVYYTGKKKEAVQLVTQREPCNIDGLGIFDKKRMEEVFGWSESYYMELYNRDNTLAQNIAIVCRTPVIGTNKKVYIINSIGSAFDNSNQPDYRHYKSTHFNINILIESFSSTFDIVFASANDLSLQKIVLCKLGCGAFSKLYPGDFFQTIWIPSLIKSLKKNINILPKKVGLMGNPSKKESSLLQTIMKKYNIEYISLGNIPDILIFEDTLYQNAWDPHSFVGNGNEADNSLDGYMGRNTVMHFMCWFPTNPYMTFISLPK